MVSVQSPLTFSVEHSPAVAQSAEHASPTSNIACPTGTRFMFFSDQIHLAHPFLCRSAQGSRAGLKAAEKKFISV